jgi:hypothetical protein
MAALTFSLNSKTILYSTNFLLVRDFMLVAVEWISCFRRSLRKELRCGLADAIHREALVVSESARAVV